MGFRVEELCSALTYRRAAAVSRGREAREWADHATITDIMSRLRCYPYFKPKCLEDLDQRALEMMEEREHGVAEQKDDRFPRLWQMARVQGDEKRKRGGSPLEDQRDSRGECLSRRRRKPVQEGRDLVQKDCPSLPGRMRSRR